MIEVIAICIVVFLVVTTLGGLLSPKRFGHNVLGWHKVRKTSGFDGASLHGTCEYCGKDCMQDSQGNWF